MAEIEPTGPLLGAVRMIARYVIAHPEAKDSEQGIYGWWLGGAEVSGGVTTVARAVDVMVERGWLTEQQLGGRRLVAACRERIPEMQRFLGAPSCRERCGG